MCECCGGDCRLCGGEVEVYTQEILDAYKKISDKFDDFTQLMRKQVPLGSLAPGEKFSASLAFRPPEMIPIPEPKESTDLPAALITKIQDMGRIEEKLLMILEDEIFDKTSKHDPYWDSKFDDHADKLDDLRRKFSCLSDNLWDIIALLRKERDF